MQRKLLAWLKLHREAVIIVGLIVFNLGLRLFRLDQPNEAYFDEGAHYVPAARAYLNGDFSLNFEHPLLGKFLIGAGIMLFGDNPWGWRLPEVVFSIIGVLVTYFLARKMFAFHPGKVWIASVAAFLLSLDFMWFVHSRIALLEIFLAVFVLITLYFLWCYLENFRLRTLFLVGFFLGLALSVKWTALFLFLAITALFFLFHKKTWRSWGTDLFVIGGTAGLVYLISYVPYLLGHSFWDFISLQQKMLNYHENINDISYLRKPVTLDESVVIHPWLWFLDSPMGYLSKNLGGGQAQLIISLSHPFVFWLSIFVFFKVGIKGLRQKTREISFLFIIFLSFYLPWFFVSRYQFIYYLLSIIPFLCITVAYFLYPYFIDKYRRWDVVGYLIAVVLSFVYLYPVLTGWQIPNNYFYFPIFK
ncbi:MAG: glycosyltransferase family 39 protein [Patescibacteria group bacterium]|nr:glycosyltransferase family 39 protein [Patescibacteria group bacterium]